MKKLILAAICLISVSTISIAQDDIQKEKESIKKVIQDAYVDGLCNNADEVAVNKGFHPGFNLIGAGKGNTMWKHPIYNWIEGAKEGKKKHKYAFQDEFTTIKFLFVDVTGNVSTAKIEFYEGDEKKFIDYLSLIKFEDGWKIISKIFYAIPKEKKGDA
ncbi:nuclear transport factor 2 family protein [Ancylomarina sp. DW003]|nr:nuclear transport factor 2 family protein [Ancylomarina sp. DW003]MDE5422779.1 nuclear transport factor 2 family protein [Ancylomarina sp. DW003]